MHGTYCTRLRSRSPSAKVPHDVQHLHEDRPCGQRTQHLRKLGSEVSGQMIVLSRAAPTNEYWQQWRCLRFAHSDTAAPAVSAVPQSAGGAAAGPGLRIFLLASPEPCLLRDASGNPQSFFPAPTSDVDFKSAVPRHSVPTEETFLQEPPAEKDFTPQSEKKPTPQSARSVGAMLSFSRGSIHGL